MSVKHYGAIQKRSSGLMLPVFPALSADIVSRKIFRSVLPEHYVGVIGFEPIQRNALDLQSSPTLQTLAHSPLKGGQVRFVRPPLSFVAIDDSKLNCYYAVFLRSEYFFTFFIKIISHACQQERPYSL
jgi:hypothetical protein